MSAIRLGYHRLLERQIRKHLGEGKPNSLEFQTFIESVNQAYNDFESHRLHLERVLEISSNELFKVNLELKAHKEELEKIVEERTAELRKATDAANRANESKAMFLSNMSHEIRTPLHAISGLTDLLLQEGFKRHIQENLESIRFSSEALMVIVDDILDFSKIEAGKLNFEQISFAPKAVFEHVSKTLGLKAAAKNIELKLDYDPFIPRVLVGDPTRFHQILLNFVGNAVKFTDKGGVLIKAVCERKEGERITLSIEISDTGIGIAPENIDRIFDSFSQASEEIGRKFGGTGLGLTISKKLIELLEGRLSVSSIPGNGSTFRFEIPFASSSGDPENNQENPLEVEPDFSDLSVLLVEDNKINQMLARQVLMKWKVTPDLAENGLIAIERMRDKHYDIMLLDLHMPVMGGFETASALRERGIEVKNPDVYIIALTADAFNETRVRVFEKGMNDYISKPFTQLELLDKMKLARQTIKGRLKGER